MRGAFVLVIAVTACGDNHQQSADAAVDASLACKPRRGTNVVLRTVATSCYAPGAPAFPACIDGTVPLVTAPPGDHRLFAIEQFGRIRIIDDGAIVAQPFLDITTTADPPLVAVSELGLLGLAFHPQFATNRAFFVFYTALGPGLPRYYNVVMRYTTRSDAPDLADAASATVILAIPDFEGNHNGGMIEFGPDGFLYVGTGDGGGQNDPQRTSQNPYELLGKILRIDVDRTQAGKPYGIPPGNPYASGLGGAPEVFIRGVRNPWRFSFDSLTGDLWIGDVGQDAIEEINVLRAGQQAGANLGWSAFEGTSCFHGPCEAAGMTPPVDSRTHASGWCAVIGGQVYRGGCFPDLQGWYFYTDYCAHGLSRARLAADGSLVVRDLPGSWPEVPASLHADAAGELYLADTWGNIFALEATD